MVRDAEGRRIRFHQGSPGSQQPRIRVAGGNGQRDWHALRRSCAGGKRSPCRTANNMATIDHLDGYFLALLPPANDGDGRLRWFLRCHAGRRNRREPNPGNRGGHCGSGTWNVPTEVLVEQIIDDTPVAELRLRPETRYVSSDVVDNWIAVKESQRINDRNFSAETAARAIEIATTADS